MYPDIHTAHPQARTFESRHQVWRDRLVRLGPGAAFPFAWRLPELARSLDRSHRLRAVLALARTLFGQGRFADSLKALEEFPLQSGDDPHLAARLDNLAGRCRWLMDLAETLPPVPDLPLPASLDLRLDGLYLVEDGASLGVALPPCREAAHQAGDPARVAWCDVLLDWTRARTGDSARPGAGLAALAALARHHPSRAALGEGILAHAAFLRDGPRALPWLDQALLQADRQGQHQEQARLLHLKAQALAADGQLADADRFLELARDTARRQGAWRWLRDMSR